VKVQSRRLPHYKAMNGALVNLWTMEIRMSAMWAEPIPIIKEVQNTMAGDSGSFSAQFPLTKALLLRTGGRDCRVGRAAGALGDARWISENQDVFYVSNFSANRSTDWVSGGELSRINCR